MLRAPPRPSPRASARTSSGSGSTWAREERQSARLARYEAAAERLKERGRLYPCYETEDELERKRKRQLARGAPPIYDRASLKLDAADRKRLESEGRRPHWRFRLDNSDEGLAPLPTIVSWNDLIRGDQTVDLGSLSDPVVIRADGTFLYTFTSVIDDADFKISHVIRGDDHVTNTGVQLELFEALGYEPPAFGHHSLLVGADGHALSKRLGALSIESLRAEAARADGGGELHGADRHLGPDRGARRPSTSWRSSSPSKRYPPRRRASMWRSSKASMRGSCTSCPSRRSPSG